MLEKTHKQSEALFDVSKIKKGTFQQYFLSRPLHTNAKSLKEINLFANRFGSSAIKALVKLSLPYAQKIVLGTHYAMKEIVTQTMRVNHLTKGKWQSLKFLLLQGNDFGLSGFCALSSLRSRKMERVMTYRANNFNYIGNMQVFAADWYNISDFCYYYGMDNRLLKSILNMIQPRKFKNNDYIFLVI